MAVNFDDVSRCPLGVRYESCGVERDDLAVCTYPAARRANSDRNILNAPPVDRFASGVRL